MRRASAKDMLYISKKAREDRTSKVGVDAPYCAVAGIY